MVNKSTILCAAFMALFFVFGYLSYRIYASVPLILTFIVGIYWLKNRTNIVVKPHWPSLFGIGGVLLITAVSLVWAEFYDVSHTRLIKFSPVLLGSLLPMSFFASVEVKRNVMDVGILKCGLIAWSVGLVFMLVDIMFNIPIYSLLHERHETLMAQLNRYAIVILLGYVFIYHLSPPKIWIPLVIPMALFLWGTQSQSVQLTAVVLVIFWSCWNILKPYMPYFIGVGITLTTIGFPWFAQWIFANRPDSVEGVFVKAAPFHRMEIWDGIVTKILASPIMGYGIENIRKTSLEIEQIYWKGESILHPHNYALQIWVEFGLIGIVMFLVWMWWAILRIGRLALPVQKLAFSLILTFFTINLTAYGLWQGWWLGLMLTTWISFYICQHRLAK